MAEGAEGTKACVGKLQDRRREGQHDRGDTGDTNHMLAPTPAQIMAKIFLEINYNVA